MADPQICYNRIQKRSRSGEEVIQLEYLTQCHEEHNIFIHQKMTSSKLLRIDGTIDINESPHILNEWKENAKFCIEKYSL